MSMQVDMTTDQAREYFQSIGVRPACMEDHPVRKARWSFMTEGLEADLAREYQAVGKAAPAPDALTHARIQTEILLENELNRICMEDLKDQRMIRKAPESIFEEIDSSAVAPFTRFSLPIIRRVTPRTYARSLVNVQAMPQPVGRIFYMNVSYGEAKAPTTAGQRVDLVTNFNERYGGGRATVEFTATASQTNFDLEDAGTSGHQLYIDGVQQTANFSVSPGAGTGGVDRLVWSGTALGAGDEVVVIYDNYAEGDNARDIDVTMASDNIEAETWALRGTMTVQTLQDFQAYQGLSGEGEMTSTLAGEINREIDFSIIDRLRAGAMGGNTNWDSAGFLSGDTTTTAQRDYRKTLYEAIISTSNLIYRKRYLNPTWIVGGVAAIERLEKLEEFKLSNVPSSPDDATVDRIYEGTLAGKFQVFKDARFNDNTLLMGYKGSSPFHSGATFAPYIPAFLTDLIPDPNINFKVRKGLMSRNGFKITIPEVYGTVTIL